MRDDEKRFASGLAAVAALGLTAYWEPWRGGAHLAFTLFSLGFASTLALTARWGNRLAAGTAAFCFGVFGPWGFAYVFGAPFVGLAAWLGIRASRDAKSVTPPPERT